MEQPMAEPSPPAPPDTPTAAPAPVAPAPAARASTAWLLRMLLTIQAAMALAQPILIGRYLDGDFDVLGAHGLNGSLLPAIDMLCLGAALAHWTLGRGRFWPVLVTLLLIPVEGTQIAAGYAHSLALLIPLGVGIVAGLLFLAAWSWTPRIRRPRTVRRWRAAPPATAWSTGRSAAQPVSGSRA